MEKVKNYLKRNYKKIISILILVFFIVFLGSFIYLITLDDGTYKVQDMSSTPYAASTYVASVKFTGEGIKFIYKDEETGKEEEKKSSEMAKIVWDEMVKAGSNVGKYLDNEEDLEKLMNAEIITQYPRLPESQVKEGYLNGTIDFMRKKSNGSEVKLKYLKLEDFNKKIEDKNADVIDYYTLDDNDNVLIGLIDETEEILTYDDDEMIISDYTSTLSESDKENDGKYSRKDINVYSKAIPYKSVVDKFRMPFQYLWAFIVIGDDKGVGLELADLVEDSDIDITIFDNITTTVNTDTFTYTKERRVDVSATATAVTNSGTFTKSKDFRPASEWVDGNYKIVHKTTYKNNTPLIDITKADVWIVDYSKEYKYKKKAEESEYTNNKDLDVTDYKKDAGSPQTSGDGSDLPFYGKFQDKLQELVQELDAEARSAATPALVGMAGQVDVQCSTSITSCEASYYKKFTNRKETDVTKTTKQKYIAGKIKNEPKVKKKTAEEIKNGTGQDNFVTILCDPTHSQARDKITNEVTSWLFELLETNPDTINKVELTKYLLNKVLERDEFDTNFSFDEFENNYFSGASGTIYGNNMEEKVWFTLISAGYSEYAVAGAMGNFMQESAFRANNLQDFYNAEWGISDEEYTNQVNAGARDFVNDGAGYGLAQWTFWSRKAGLLNFANSMGASIDDEDMQIKYLLQEMHQKPRN